MAKAAPKTGKKGRAGAVEEPAAGRKGKKLDRMSDDDLNGIAGGMRGEFSSNIDLLRLRVKCPVPECGFECGEFSDMNIHMRTCHPERC